MTRRGFFGLMSGMAAALSTGWRWRPRPSIPGSVTMRISADATGLTRGLSGMYTALGVALERTTVSHGPVKVQVQGLFLPKGSLHEHEVIRYGDIRWIHVREIMCDDPVELGDILVRMPNGRVTSWDRVCTGRVGPL